MTSHGKDKPRTLFSFVLSFQFRVQFRSESFYYIKAAACPLCIMFENGQNRITARWPSHPGLELELSREKFTWLMQYCIVFYSLVAFKQDQFRTKRTVDP